MNIRPPALAISVLVGTFSALSQTTVTDDLGRTISLPAAAQRIVSLAPSITESLFAIGAGDCVVGVTDYCDYPPAAKAKRRVGGIINPNIETILSLKPDLILLSMEGNVREDFTTLTSFNVPVFVSNPRTLDGIYRSIEQLGTLTGQTRRATRLMTTLRARADSLIHLASLSPKRTVLFFVSWQPIIIVGKHTFLSELISLAGGINAATDVSSSYPAYSREAVLKDNPDVLIFMADVLSDPAALVKLYPEWSKLKAFRQNQIFRIDPDIVSRPGPRAVDGLWALYTRIHTTH